MAVFSASATTQTVLRKIVLSLFVLLTIFTAGCSNDNHSSSEAKTVFATVDLPSTAEEVDVWLSELAVRAERLRGQVASSQAVDWPHDLLPLYDLMLDLVDAKNYCTVLMERSPDPAVRAMGYGGYQQLPQLLASLVFDSEVQSAVEEGLSRLPATNAKQQQAEEYFSNAFSSEFSPEQLAEILHAEDELTAVSLAYYLNTVTKSASGTFAAEDFACLPPELLAQIPTDDSGDFIFDANNSSLYFTLARSCLDEPVREQLHSVFASKAAAENAPLWPLVLQRRLTYAELQGFEDFSDMRLSHTMLQTSARVRALIEQVKTISDPAFARLQQRYREVQFAAEGIDPETVTVWNRDRYFQEVKGQLMGTAPVNPRLLSYPHTFDRMLYLLGKVVGLRFEKNDLAEKRWSSEVVEYLAYDQTSNAVVGTLLVDPYQIEGVDSTPSCQILQRSRVLDSGDTQAPVVVLKTNLTKASSGTTLLASSDYVTFGHELGHALHQLGQEKYGDAQKDFIEVPSMFCQNLVQYPEFFKALLSDDPDVPLAEIPSAFAQYWHYYRQSPQTHCEQLRWDLAGCAVSLDATTWQGGTTTDLAEVAKSHLQKFFYPYSSSSQPFYDFFHLISPATDAYYYQYVLAEVIAADILSVFDASPDSIFDRQLGALYRQDLLEGSSPESEAAITDFLGRPWSYEAFQRRFEEQTAGL